MLPPRQQVMRLGPVPAQRVDTGAQPVALHRDMVLLAAEVRPEAHLEALVIVVDVEPARRLRQPVAAHPVAVDAHRPRLPDGEAVPRGDGPRAGPRRPADQRPQRLLRVLAGDADDAVDRVRPVECPARPADHLDLLDILDHRLVQVPEDRRIERRIDRPPVDQRQQLVARLDAVEPARRDRELRRVDLLHVEVGRQPQHARQAQRARLLDILARNDEHARRHAGQGLGPLRSGCHLDVGELLDAEVGKVILVIRRGDRGRHDEGILGREGRVRSTDTSGRACGGQDRYRSHAHSTRQSSPPLGRSLQSG